MKVGRLSELLADEGGADYVPLDIGDKAAIGLHWEGDLADGKDDQREEDTREDHKHEGKTQRAQRDREQLAQFRAQSQQRRTQVRGPAHDECDERLAW